MAAKGRGGLTPSKSGRKGVTRGTIRTAGGQLKFRVRGGDAKSKTVITARSKKTGKKVGKVVVRGGASLTSTGADSGA